MEYKHKSVLLKESVDALGIGRNPDGLYLDGTVGGAGHSREMLARLGEKGSLLGIDRDKDVFANAGRVLNDFFGRYMFIHGNFSDFSEIADSQGIEKIDGALLDLGMSSYQIDNADRGFSYMNDAPLDMRMDADSEISAFDVVNRYGEEELGRIIYRNGEERWAKRIAEFIVREREKSPINTTFELVSVIKKAIPKGAREDGPHPAKRTFQALRIEVNRELEILEKAVYDIFARMNPGGRLAVISFHSLEDRKIKNAFKNLENPCDCPSEFPVCLCGKLPQIKIITKKPITPSKEELERNPRSRSAKLRIAEKL